MKYNKKQIEKNLGYYDSERSGYFGNFLYFQNNIAWEMNRTIGERWAFWRQMNEKYFSML